MIGYEKYVKLKSQNIKSLVKKKILLSTEPSNLHAGFLFN